MINKLVSFSDLLRFTNINKLEVRAASQLRHIARAKTAYSYFDDFCMGGVDSDRSHHFATEEVDKGC